MPTPPLPDHVLLEAVEMYAKFGEKTSAARHIGIHRNTFEHRLKLAKQRGIGTINEQLDTLHGHNPAYGLTHTVPAPLIVRGTSTLYKDGEQKLQWVKTKLSDMMLEETMKAVISALAADLPKYLPEAPTSHPQDDELLNLYVVTDFHLGMLADADECGENWDTKIAEKLFVDWFGTAISLAPLAKKAVLCNLGDLQHTDGWEALTPVSKHLLDVDTRFSKTIRSCIRMIRTVIKMLLQKYEEVHIIMADANHDAASSAWLRELLAQVYEDEKRITVDLNMDTYYCVEHGLTSLFFHHGHKKQVDNVDDVFVSKYRQVFGRSKFSYAHLGHLHSNQSKETNLMMVERHRTLCASDAYSAKGGWVSGRDAKVITYHKQFGEVARVTISPEMVRHHIGENQC